MCSAQGTCIAAALFRRVNADALVAVCHTELVPEELVPELGHRTHRAHWRLWHRRTTTLPHRRTTTRPGYHTARYHRAVPPPPHHGPPAPPHPNGYNRGSGPHAPVLLALKLVLAPILALILALKLALKLALT